MGYGLTTLGQGGHTILLGRDVAPVLLLPRIERSG